MPWQGFKFYTPTSIRCFTNNTVKTFLRRQDDLDSHQCWWHIRAPQSGCGYINAIPLKPTRHFDISLTWQNTSINRLHLGRIIAKGCRRANQRSTWSPSPRSTYLVSYFPYTHLIASKKVNWIHRIYPPTQ